MSDSMPNQMPPAKAEVDLTCIPCQMPPLEMAADAIKLSMEPTLLPPATSESQSDQGITAWQNNQKITALWSNNANRNAWAHVANIGWKKMADNSDSAVVAFNVLAAHALLKGTVVNYRDEADTKIHEMYVW